MTCGFTIKQNKMKELTETEKLVIRRNMAKKRPLYDIADRIGITVAELKTYLKTVK